MLRRLVISAASWFAIGGLILTASAGFAEHRGGGFGGFGSGGAHSGGFGGGHFGGAGAPAGGLRSFSNPGGLGAGQFRGPGGHIGGFGGGYSSGFRAGNLGRLHFTRPGFAGRFTHGSFAGHSRSAGAFRAMGGRVAGRTRFATAHRDTSAVQNRIAHNWVVRNERNNRRSAAALRNRNNRVANERIGSRANRARAGVPGAAIAAERQRAANNVARQGLPGNAAFQHGNGFANARWGGHGWGDHNRGFRRFWAGGIFWPYFLGDYFSYAFWPYGYYGTFWDWGPDVLLWSAFWPDYDYPYWDYGYYGAGYPSEGGEAGGDIYSGYRHGYRYRYAAVPRQTGRAAAIGPQEAAGTCAGFAPGVNDLPIQRIAEIVQPTPEQHGAFDELKDAMVKASSILSNACPAQTPQTPVGRLDAMEQRLKAMQKAGEVVRRPLEKFHAMLNPAQKQRLDEAMVAESALPRGVDLARLCSSQAAFTDVAADDIARTIKLDNQQMRELQRLKEVSAKAAEILRNSCPTHGAGTLEARLDAADQRMGALIQATGIIQPAISTFFASLSEAQRNALDSQAPSTKAAASRR